MLTLFAVPKPFLGHVGEIQRNALESWRALASDIQVVLVGDEEGVAEAAREAGVEHVGGLALNARGTPHLDSAFERIETVARRPLWCLVNADIILLDDFVRAVERVASAFPRFLMVGETRNLVVSGVVGLDDPQLRAGLRERAVAEGTFRGYAALDYFVFPKGEFGRLPPFLIGRACFDNWLVWRVREIGDPVVDATRSVVAVHQAHDYSHIAGGFDEAYYGEEAKYNESLAGGRSHVYTLHDATHRLHRRGPPLLYWGSILRARERLRSARVHAQVRIELRRELRRTDVARRSHQRRSAERDADPAACAPAPVRLLAVAPKPEPGWTQVLNDLARLADLEVTALYAAPALDASSADGAPSPDHLHWFPRSFMLPGARSLTGRDYRINWAIWNSYRGLRPDCMLVFGWSTFAAQSAIAWCLARRVPYLLVVDKGVQDLPRTAARGASVLLVHDAPGREAMVTAGVSSVRVRLLDGESRSAADDISALAHLAVEARWSSRNGRLGRWLSGRSTQG